MFKRVSKEIWAVNLHLHIYIYIWCNVLQWVQIQYLAQEICIASVIIFIVAELLARFPSTLIATTNPNLVVAMDALRMSPMESFVEPGINKETHVDVAVGDAVFRVCVVGVADLAGSAALGEEKQVLVDKFAEMLGKHQDTEEDSFTDSS